MADASRSSRTYVTFRGMALRPNAGRGKDVRFWFIRDLRDVRMLTLRAGGWEQGAPPSTGDLPIGEGGAPQSAWVQIALKTGDEVRPADPGIYGPESNQRLDNQNL